MNWITRRPVGICGELETWLVVWEKNLKPGPGEGGRFLGCGILRAKTREVSGKPGHVGHATYCTWIANLYKHGPLTKPSPVKQLGTFDSDLEVQGEWFLHSLPLPLCRFRWYSLGQKTLERSMKTPLPLHPLGSFSSSSLVSRAPLTTTMGISNKSPEKKIAPPSAIFTLFE